MALNANNEIINGNGGIVVQATAVSGGYFTTNSIEITDTGEAGKIPRYACVEGAICYCKNDNRFYQYDGTNWVEKVDNFNITNGEGIDSIVQIYSGAEDSTHFGNKDYLLDEEGNPVKDKNGEILYGESAAIFGEANSNNANRALLAGKLNNNSGANAIVGGLRNTVKAPHGITIGSVNTVEASAIRSVTAGYNNINSGEDSIQTGTSNKNYGIGSAEFGCLNINRGHYSALIGSGNINRGGNYSALIGVNLRNEQQNEDGTYNTKVIVGKWNLDKLENIFEVGNGTANAERSNAFEVLYDGRAKVKTKPEDEDDVVRKAELDKKVSVSDINQAFFNSLYN